LPTIYEPHELTRFFETCRDSIVDYARYKALLMLGLRKDELRFGEWSDISEAGFHVHAKPGYGFNPKAHEERCIPIPKKLRVLLNQIKGMRPGTLIFPTKSGLPDRHMLRTCKRIARRAGLNVEESCLHKFRRTYCTNLLRQGVDIRTVQKLMGHADIQSTMRYLRPLEGMDLKTKIEAVFA
jgi:integrase